MCHMFLILHFSYIGQLAFLFVSSIVEDIFIFVLYKLKSKLTVTITLPVITAEESCSKILL